MYLALSILENLPDFSVTIIEKRSAVNRPQVVLLPSRPILLLPDAVKEKLWPDAQVREATLGPRSRQDAGFWPESEVKYLKLGQIGEFCVVIKDYLEEKFSDRFNYVFNDNFSVKNFKTMSASFNIVFVAAGNGVLTQELRKTLNIFDLSTDSKSRKEIDRRGAYLVYKIHETESYERNGKLIKRIDFLENGVTYTASNHSTNHIQVYTYPVGKLQQVFEEMPESFKKTAAFSSYLPSLTLNGLKGGKDALSRSERRWLITFSSTVKEIFESLHIPYPSDNEIEVYFATRGEYHYKTAAKSFEGIPILFLGDACGSTDYKQGLSLGRGLINVVHLIEKMRVTTDAFIDLIHFQNNYWQKVVSGEFNQENPLIFKSSEIFFKYIMDGMVVDGMELEKESFIKELQT